MQVRQPKFPTALALAANVITTPEHASEELKSFLINAFTVMRATTDTPKFANDERAQKGNALLLRAIEALQGKELNEAERAGLIYDLIEFSAEAQEALTRKYEFDALIGELKDGVGL